MKKYLFTAFVLVAAYNLKAQTDSLYAVTYTTGPAWNSAKPPHEQTYFKEHSANLSQWRKDGIIKLGARYGDKGIIVITAPSLTAAKELIGKETSVANKLFVADVQKFNVFYYGCLEKPVPKN